MIDGRRISFTTLARVDQLVEVDDMRRGGILQKGLPKWIAAT